MKTTSAATALGFAVAAGSAAAQTSPVSIAMGAMNLISPECQKAVYSLTNQTSELFQCLQVDALLPAILTNGSIVDPVDKYLSTVCSSAPCTNETMSQTVDTLVQGCSKDLEMFGISNSTIAPFLAEVYPAYILARDVACLKTNETESSANSTMMPSANATMSMNSSMYNTTNGTFCLTSLATELQSYLGVNLTNNYIDTAALGGNSTALMALKSIPQTALCNDCIFAAADLINEAYPAFGNITVSKTTNATIDSYLNSTCSAKGLNVTADGKLPQSIHESAVNATASNGTVSILPVASMSSLPISEIVASATGMPSLPSTGAMAEKRRWIGQA